MIVELVDEMKCLGIVVNRNFDFKRHIDTLQCCIRFQLRRLYCLDAHLPFHIRKRVTLSLLLLQVNYCLEVVSGILLVKCNGVIMFLVLLMISWDCSYVDLCLLQCHYIVMCNFDSPFRDKFVFSNPQMLCPRFSNSIGERSFLIRAVRLWYQLPLTLRTFLYINYLFRFKVIEFLHLNI